MNELIDILNSLLDELFELQNKKSLTYEEEKRYTDIVRILKDNGMEIPFGIEY